MQTVTKGNPIPALTILDRPVTPDLIKALTNYDLENPPVEVLDFTHQFLVLTHSDPKTFSRDDLWHLAHHVNLTRTMRECGVSCERVAMKDPDTVKFLLSINPHKLLPRLTALRKQHPETIDVHTGVAAAAILYDYGLFNRPSLQVLTPNDSTALYRIVDFDKRKLATASFKDACDQLLDSPRLWFAPRLQSAIAEMIDNRAPQCKMIPDRLAPAESYARVLQHQNKWKPVETMLCLLQRCDIDFNASTVRSGQDPIGIWSLMVDPRLRRVDQRLSFELMRYISVGNVQFSPHWVSTYTTIDKLYDFACEYSIGTIRRFFPPVPLSVHD